MSPKVCKVVPLPISHYNEPGMYWFLAEISMRRLYIYALRSVWKESGIVYEPGTVYELGIVYEPMLIEVQQQQVCEWYESLHPHVKFPEHTLPLLEPQKAFLRSQYFGLRWFICWPAVVYLLTKEPDDEKQHADLLRFSTEAIHYLIQHILSAETLVQQRHQMLFATLVGYVLLFSFTFPSYIQYILHITLR